MERDITINGVRFSSADTTVTLLGRVSQGVTSIAFDEEQDVTDVRVVGNRKSVGHVAHNIRYQGTMEMLEEEVKGLELSNGVSSLLKLRTFPITVGYWKEGLFTKKVLKHVKIRKVGRAIQGDSSDALVVPIEFWFGDLS